MHPTTNEFRNLLCFSMKISNISECHMDKIHHSFPLVRSFFRLLTHCFFFFCEIWFFCCCFSWLTLSQISHTTLFALVMLSFSLFTSRFVLLRWRRSTFGSFPYVFYRIFRFFFVLFDSAWSLFMIICAAHMLSTVKKYALSISISAKLSYFTLSFSTYKMRFTFSVSFTLLLVLQRWW